MNSKSKNKNPILRFITGKSFGLILALIQLIISVVFLGFIAEMSLLPIKYFALLAVILFMLFLIPFIAQMHPKTSNPFKFMILIVSAALIFVYGKYIRPINNLVDNIGNSNTQTYVMALYSLADEDSSIEENSDYLIGYIGGSDLESSTKYVDELRKSLDISFDSKEFVSYEDGVVALFNREIDALILNTAYIELITDSSMIDHLDADMQNNFLNFTTLTKVVKELEYEVEIPTVEPEENYVRPNVTTEPFCMYISGIDVYGKITKTSRSDVNILAFINPQTKQVLLINTPRDSYVVNPYSYGKKDKLTHAAIYGIDSSMGALSDIYDIDVDFFFRVNFTGFTKIIDALDGVNVYSQYTFSVAGQEFVKGYNELNGKQALLFCRERKSFPGGDRQRGKNQMAVISAVIKKMASSKLLTNYSDIIESIDGSFQTSLTSDEISSLIKMQINDMASWNIQTYSVDGAGSMEYTYTSPNSKRSVILLNEETIEKAKILMDQVYNGETINLDAVK